MYLRTIPLLFSCGFAFCQKAVVPAGEDVAGPNGSVSFTVGQIDYLSISSSGSVYEGVQQPYELFVLDLSETVADIAISVYPNPVVSFLTISKATGTEGTLNYTLTDANGRVVLVGDLLESETQLDVRNLASSAYFLNITKDDRIVRSYKLIKRIE